MDPTFKDRRTLAVQDWVATLNSDSLTRLEDMIQQERRRRNRSAALPDEAVQREVERLLAVRDARRREAADQREAHVVRCLQRRIQLFEEGRLGMCSCTKCLAGYVSLDTSRMCPEGQRQFWHDAGQWQPYTP